MNFLKIWLFCIRKTFYWVQHRHCTKMKFSIKVFFSKCDQICSFLRIWSRLLRKSLMENFIFYAVRADNLFRIKLESLNLDHNRMVFVNFLLLGDGGMVGMKKVEQVCIFRQGTFLRETKHWSVDLQFHIFATKLRQQTHRDWIDVFIRLWFLFGGSFGRSKFARRKQVWHAVFWKTFFFALSL